MVKDLVIAGLLALKDYVATHVLTCLLPAFLFAGAMVTFINREAILEYLGEKANKIRSFSVASLSSFLLAACSCTVIPVAGGLFYSGAGIGVAFIVLWLPARERWPMVPRSCSCTHSATGCRWSSWEGSRGP